MKWINSKELSNREISVLMENIQKSNYKYSKICFFYRNCNWKKVADFIRNKKLLQFFALQIICKIQSLLSLGPHMKTIYLYSNLHFFPYSPMFPCSDRLFWIFTGNFLCIYDYILVLTYMVFHMDKMDLKNELNYLKNLEKFFFRWRSEKWSIIRSS